MPSMTLVAEATSWSSGRAFALADQGVDLVDDGGHAVGGGVDAARAWSLVAARTSVSLATSCGLAGLVGDLPDRGEGGVDVVDGAAGAQVGDDAAELGERGLDRAGQVRDALALDEGVHAVDEPGGGGDQLVERQGVGLGRQRLDLGDHRGRAVGGGADAGERGLGGGEHVVEVGDELRLGRLVDQRLGRGEDGGDLRGRLLDAAVVDHAAQVGDQRRRGPRAPCARRRR